MIDEDTNLEVNLCQMLNIYVDGIALKLAMGIDPWAEKENEYKTDISKNSTHSQSCVKTTITCPVSENGETIMNVIIDETPKKRKGSMRFEGLHNMYKKSGAKSTSAS